MHDVFKGIVVGFIGFVIWVIFSFMEGLNRAFGEETTIGSTGMFLGFALMVGGPVVYIVILPILRWWRRRHTPQAP